MVVHAGHGIDYRNIRPLLRVTEITGYSIGFAIVARALFVGLRQAVQEMVDIIKGAR
jgi:pyridoxine 5-phosphate synthase